MKSKILAIVVCLALLVTALTGIISVQSQVAPEMTIAETAQANGNFTNLVAALNATNLTQTLNGTGPFTVFAPIDSAFNAISPAVLQNLLTNDTTNLTKILTYHVVPGIIALSDIGNTTLKTVEGSNVIVTNTTNGTFINAAKVIAGPVNASNGVIYAIDQVLMPPVSIVNTLMNNSNLSTMVSALNTTNQTKTLNGTGPFTVFAPTNDAFTAAAINMSDTTNVTKIVQYHVVPGTITVAQLQNNTTLTTAEGQKINVTVVGTDVFFNGEKVTMTQVVATNGSVIIIDKVLMPPVPTTLPAPGNNTTTPGGGCV